MDGRRESLRELVERGPLARVNDGENDEMEENRSMTVGGAIGGAATTTHDSARLDAAPVFNQPTHNNLLSTALVQSKALPHSKAVTSSAEKHGSIVAAVVIIAAAIVFRRRLTLPACLPLHPQPRSHPHLSQESAHVKVRHRR